MRGQFGNNHVIFVIVRFLMNKKVEISGDHLEEFCQNCGVAFPSSDLKIYLKDGAIVILCRKCHSINERKNLQMKKTNKGNSCRG